MMNRNKLENLIQESKVKKVVLTDENGVELLHSDLFGNNNEVNVFAVLTADDEDTSSMALLGSLSDYDSMVLMHNLIQNISERNGINTITIAMDAATGAFESRSNCDHDCANCDSCGQPVLDLEHITYDGEEDK